MITTDEAIMTEDYLEKNYKFFLEKLPELKQKGIQTEFNFFQADPNSGYENRGVGIMKFENYSWKRLWHLDLKDIY